MALCIYYRAAVTFGLNALYGRTIGSDGSVNGPWNSSNAESLIRYTVNKGYSILGWELGKQRDYCLGMDQERWKKYGFWPA